MFWYLLQNKEQRTKETTSKEKNLTTEQEDELSNKHEDILTGGGWLKVGWAHMQTSVKKENLTGEDIQAR